MGSRFIAGLATFALVAGFSCTAFADDAAAQQEAMMENHKQWLMKMAEMMGDMNGMMEMHASQMKADKTMKSQAAAMTTMAKDAKNVGATFTKMAAQMDKVKGMKPMDPSKMDPKAKGQMGKMMNDEKDLVALMQKDLDEAAKMMPGAAPAAPAPGAPAPAPAAPAPAAPPAH